MPLSPAKLDELAESYLNQKVVLESEQATLDRLRDQLIAAVERDGHTPARAVKSKALLGDEYELRVAYPAEVTVDTRVAIFIRGACRWTCTPKLFKRLFKSVETFTLADGAQNLINSKKLPKHAPRNLRSLFARAIRVRELAPQLEVRERGVDGKSSPSGKNVRERGVDGKSSPNKKAAA
jgi:hypothetical protein